MIPYGRQHINQRDIDSILEVLQSDFLTQGPMVPRFEQMVADKVGAKYAVGVNSATSALHIACLALGLGQGDWLWTSPNTFVASANCALYCGASVDFVDIDPLTYNMCVKKLRYKLEEAERENKLPKIIIPVHFSGQSCEMAEIFALSQRYGFKIIEDASHAIGGKYKNKYVGNCAFSDITVFSFHPVKIVTTGEGGLALTNDASYAEKMQMYRTHGITRDVEKISSKPGDWYYEQLELGFNYRLTDIQAALGCSQIGRLDEFIQRRHVLASVYHQHLRDLPIILPHQSPESYSAYHLYVIQMDSKNTPITRKEVFDFLRKEGIGVNVHYIPVHLQPYYKKMQFYEGQFLEAEKYYAHAITLPLFFDLKKESQLKVIEVLQRCLQ